jgi:ribosomal protein S18 acetylase RimI-like enzyme
MTISYEVYRAADRDEMANLLGEVFSERDPPAVAAGLTASEFEHFVRLLCPKAAADGLSIVARADGTGEMVGALLAEDSASALPDGLDTLSTKFNPIFDILGRLDAEYRKGVHAQPGESLHLMLLGVARQHVGRGIGNGLVAACLKNNAPRGFRVAVTEATNATSQHIFRKHGFVERVRGSYSRHRYEGQAHFVSIAAEHEGPILFDKRLGQG